MAKVNGVGPDRCGWELRYSVTYFPVKPTYHGKNHDSLKVGVAITLRTRRAENKNIIRHE